jgi:hypothetical protein
MVLAHGGDPSRIHSCVRLSDGRVSITTDPNDTCPAKAATDPESPVDWNMESAPGAPGPDGFQGPTGPQGPAGSPGKPGADSELDLRLVAAASRALAPGLGTVVARCPSNEFAISGGWKAQDPSGAGRFQPLESRPVRAGRGWLVRVDGRHAHRGWRLTVQAQCAAKGK